MWQKLDQRERFVIRAVLISDLHLSHKPPAIRTDDRWYRDMARYLKQLKRLADHHQVPIIAAGDIFHHWNEPAELISFAIKHCPKVFAVAGQHDLPYHNLSDIKKSAYWTLVEAGVITNLEYGKPYHFEDLSLYGFPFGTEIIPCSEPHSLTIEVAVIHSFIWTQRTGYPGAPKEQRLRSYLDKLKGYDVALFGDNHQTIKFTTKAGLTVFNPGTFIRRRRDEISHRPCVGLLLSDRSVKIHHLDTSKDRFSEEKEAVQSTIDTSGLLDELKDLESKPLDFKEACLRACDNRQVKPGVRKCVVEALET